MMSRSLSLVLLILFPHAIAVAPQLFQEDIVPGTDDIPVSFPATALKASHDEYVGQVSAGERVQVDLLWHNDESLRLYASLRSDEAACVWFVTCVGDEAWAVQNTCSIVAGGLHDLDTRALQMEFVVPFDGILTIDVAATLVTQATPYSLGIASASGGFALESDDSSSTTVPLGEVCGIADP
jgi:hypothetical protein